MSKYQAYAITLRPSGGVNDEQLTTFVKWVTKYSTYSLVVTEKEGSDRHIHAGVFLKAPTLKGNVWKLLVRLPLSLSDTEKRVFQQGLKPMFNHDWIDYCRKGDSTQILHSNLPESECLESYFPTKTAERSYVKKSSPYYLKLEGLWYEHVSPGVEVNPRNIRNFLFKMMYSERLIDVIKDDKQIIQVSRHLSRFISKADESTIESTIHEWDCDC